jgi:hypothetical protein
VGNLLGFTYVRIGPACPLTYNMLWLSPSEFVRVRNISALDPLARQSLENA